MSAFLAAAPIFLAITMGAVIIVMFVGLFNMGRGGVRGSKLSNKMMRFRVGIQGLAIIILALFLFFSAR